MYMLMMMMSNGSEERVNKKKLWNGQSLINRRPRQMR